MWLSNVYARPRKAPFNSLYKKEIGSLINRPTPLRGCHQVRTVNEYSHLRRGQWSSINIGLKSPTKSYPKTTYMITILPNQKIMSRAEHQNGGPANTDRYAIPICRFNTSQCDGSFQVLLQRGCDLCAVMCFGATQSNLITIPRHTSKERRDHTLQITRHDGTWNVYSIVW